MIPCKMFSCPIPRWFAERSTMNFKRICAAVTFSLAVVFLAVAVYAGHVPVCCKGYAYWDIYEAHQGGHRWRSVKNPITLREVPIAPSIWSIPEAQSRSLLVMMAKAQQQAYTSKVKVRSWDAICWHYGSAEPTTPLSWPVQP